jgi:hypothetical protein
VSHESVIVAHAFASLAHASTGVALNPPGRAAPLSPVADDERRRAPEGRRVTPDE